MAQAIGRIPDAAATIVPYDVQSRIRQAFPGLFEERMARLLEKLQEQITRDEQQLVDSYEHPRPSPTVIPVAGLIAGHLGTVEGRVEEVSQIRKAGKTTQTAVIGDRSGELRVKFSPPAGADIWAAATGHGEGSPIPQRTGLYVQPVVPGSRDTGIGLGQEANGTLRFRQSIGRGDPANRPNTLI